MGRQISFMSEVLWWGSVDGGRAPMQALEPIDVEAVVVESEDEAS
jgi:hypothetical protein